ncbi:hypothetical protein Tco_1396458, partial [Tanacetum coccineum]
MDDLYNNLKVYEPEVKGTSSSNTSTQNIDFMSSNNSGSTNEAVNTAHEVSATSTQVSAANSINVDNLSDVVICAFFSSQTNNPQLANEDLQQLHPNDMEEMDLRWQMAMLTMRARRFLKNIGRRITINGNKTIGNRESSRRSVPIETTTSNALISCDGLGGYDRSDQAEEGTTNYALMAYSSSSSDSKVSNDSTFSESCLETVKTLKSQYDQLHKDFKKSELMVIAYKMGLESIEEKLEVYKANESIYSLDIKVLKFEIECKDIAIRELKKKLEIAQKEKDGIQFNFTSEPVVIKPVVENGEAKASEAKPKVVRKNNGAPMTEDWVSDSEEENVSQTKIEKKTAKPSYVKIDFVKAKQTNKTNRKTAKQRVNTVKDKNVNAGRPKAVVNAAKPKAAVNAIKGYNVNVVKASACWVWKPKTKLLDHVSKHNSASITLKKFDYVDAQGRYNGCSRHMTGNMSYLTDYEEIDGGCVAFGGNPKGGKITRK